jgi:hypothetical protein
MASGERWLGTGATMAGAPSWRRVLDGVLSIGSYPGEPETQAGGRRVLVAALVVGTLLNIPTVISDFNAGYTLVAAVNLVLVAVTPIFLGVLRRRPYRLAWIINGIFVLVLAVQLLETTVYGGLLGSGLVVVFGLAFMLGTLVAIGLKAAVWWFVAFTASVGYAVVIPGLIDPIYELPDPATDAAFTSSPRVSWSWPPSPTSPTNATASSGDPTTCSTTSSLTRSPTGSRTAGR